MHWWGDGLAFECHRCGNCCRGAGNVWISDAEITALARALEMTADELRSVYTRAPEQEDRERDGEAPRTLLRQKSNEDCVFWDERSGCTIYAHRPRQCRTYPFWRGILHARETWESEASSCAGIGSGRIHTVSEISAAIESDGIPLHRTSLRARAKVD